MQNSDGDNWQAMVDDPMDSVQFSGKLLIPSSFCIAFCAVVGAAIKNCSHSNEHFEIGNDCYARCHYCMAAQFVLQLLLTYILCNSTPWAYAQTAGVSLLAQPKRFIALELRTGHILNIKNRSMSYMRHRLALLTHSRITIIC